MPGLLNKLRGAQDVNKVGVKPSESSIDKSDLERLDNYHAPLRNRRRELNKLITF